MKKMDNDSDVRSALKGFKAPDANVSKVKSSVMSEINNEEYKNMGPAAGYNAGNGLWAFFALMTRPRYSVSMFLFIFTFVMGFKAYNSFEKEKISDFAAEYNQYLIEEDYYKLAEETLNQVAADELYELYEDYERSEEALQAVEGV